MRSPRQNRVDPWGELHTIDARGTRMGNRGILHDASGRIVRRWQSPRWITCVLAFGDVRRQVFSPNNYTELFFIDEATAFAAGHRPCAQCQRDRYNEFRTAWAAGNSASGLPSAEVLDQSLRMDQKERAQSRAPGAAISNLPVGTIFGIGDQAFLVCKGGVRRWTFFGYEELTKPDLTIPVAVLTPTSVVAAFRAGFEPVLHSSAKND